MEEDKVPKLIPTWHDLSLQDIVQQKPFNRYAQDKLPDYGGIGIDINGTGSKCNTLKHVVNEVPFAARVCSLPFFPPNKVSLNSDPCLTPLIVSKTKFERFCVTLTKLRTAVNNDKGKIRKEILSCHKAAKRVCSTGKFQKFSVSDSVMHLSSEFPQNHVLSEANFAYLDGCLTSSQTESGNYILLHPSGKKLNKLAFTILEETCDTSRTFKTDDSTNVIKLKSGFIQKVKSAVPGYCFVQQGKFCHFVNFTNTTEISHFHYTKLKNAVNIAASPYNPVELIAINDTGSIELHDVETKERLWTTNNIEFTELLSKSGGPLTCDFGPHPKSALSLTDQYVHLYDMRMKGNSQTTIFSSDHSSCYVKEKLITLKSSSWNPFQHFVSSSHHLYVCDDRYPCKPVLIWNHLLKTFPLYCDIVCFDSRSTSSDLIVLLGTQESRELVSFAVQSQLHQIHPISLNSPLFLSSLTDFVNSLKFHGLRVNEDIDERLSYPLIGSCALPHTNKKGFTAFQLSSFGDLFYQDFEANVSCATEKTYLVDMGCVLSPPDRILPHVSNWINFSIKHTEGNISSRKNLINVNVDLKEIISASKQPSSRRCICKSNQYNGNENDVSSGNCSLCSLGAKESDELSEGFNRASLLSGPLLEDSNGSNFNTSSLSEFADDYSKEILKVWVHPEAVDLERSDWDHYSDVSQLSPVSSKSYLSAASTQSLDDSAQMDLTDFEASQQNISQPITHPSGSDFSLMIDSFEEFVPPSQEVRSLIGETLRTPKTPTIIHSKRKSSVAGF